MLKVLLPACIALILLFLGDNSAAANTPEAVNWEETLRRDGLAATEAGLVDQEQTAETAFLLGGVRFLRAFETIMQVRYANYAGALPIIPGMRYELPPNPDAMFDPAFFEIAMTRALEHLSGAEQTLEVAVAGEFSVEMQLADIWFDINADGERDEWEGLLHLMAELNARSRVDDFDGIICFDSADADWLKAYVHLVSGMAELALSVDPTPAIRRIAEGRAALEQAGEIRDLGNVDDTLPETIGAILLCLRGVPDRDRTRAAHAHFKAMIAHNHAFWDKVQRETDNNREWLPNAQQTAAFGVEVGAETAEEWQQVLSEIEAILDGELLIPYWRIGLSSDVGVGVNLAKLMHDPGDMDLVLWLQGTGAAPFLEEGPLADMAAWRRFMSMTRGNGLLFAAWFN